MLQRDERIELILLKKYFCYNCLAYILFILQKTHRDIVWQVCSIACFFRLFVQQLPDLGVLPVSLQLDN